MRCESNQPFNVKSFLGKIGEGRSITKRSKGEVVFSQGQPADAVFYIQKGKIKLVVTSDQGKEAVVAILGTDEFFGEGCLAKQPLRMATAKTITESEVMRLEKHAIRRVLHDQPDFSEMFIAHIVARANRAEQDLVDQLFNSSEQRLARALLLLANFGKNSVPESLILNIDQSTLADIIGTTRSRVNFFMNKFRKLGLINYDRGKSGFNDYNGGIKVHNSLLNMVLHEQPEIQKSKCPSAYIHATAEGPLGGAPGSGSHLPLLKEVGDGA